MSKTSSIMLQAAAGSAGGNLDITDVFNTYLYEGTGAAHTITNDIDLAGEGGLVWIKKRNSATNSDHMLFDTERGANNRLRSNTTDQAYTVTQQLNSFNSNGFTLGTDSPAAPNVSGDNYASWTFRKAPKFFDVVTYTGDGVAGREIAHNLGSAPGCIIIKRTDSAMNWQVTHRGTANPMKDYLILDLNGGVYGTNSYFAVSDTTFTVSSGSYHNASGGTYVAYLFAHNDGDGGFGPDGDQDIIKCGSYTGNGSNDGPEIDLGFEPQFVLVKNSSVADNWVMVDTMRGFCNSNTIYTLYPNTDTADFNASVRQAHPTAKGFKVTAYSGDWNSNGDTYIYMAIRRGSLFPPKSAADVFDVELEASISRPDVIEGSYGFDTAIGHGRNSASTHTMFTRLTDSNFSVENNASEEYLGSYGNRQLNGSIVNYSYSGISTVYHMWKRAPHFHETVCYTGNGTYGHTIDHNLGVVPEFMMVKRRDGFGFTQAYTLHNGGTEAISMSGGQAPASYIWYWNNTDATSTQFTLGNNSTTNSNGSLYVAHLFASVAGVSKCGTYVGDGTSDGSNVVDCGFTNGARFVLIKKVSGTGEWYVWDSDRGITTGNDPILELGRTNTEITVQNWIDPANSGFAPKLGNGWQYTNQSGQTYFFYAIAA